MNKTLLNKKWTMHCENPDAGLHDVTGDVPCSVYSLLLASKQMEDPYYRENELPATDLLENDYTFSTEFSVGSRELSYEHRVLRFNGIDTLAEIFLNGIKIGDAFNFHRYWEFDVTASLREGLNTLVVMIKSPNKFIAEKDAEKHIGGSTDAMAGFPQLRKPHCMFGWDWGARLPDAGIWQDVELLCWNSSRIDDMTIKQLHEDNGRKVSVTVNVKQTGKDDVRIEMTSPDGEVYVLENGRPFSIPSPQLWWPNGLGAQPLYTVKATLTAPDGETETKTQRIGLRTLTMKREKDEVGETFAACCNGQSYFTMGADYIPEDNIFPWLSKERTEKLLDICKESHFNAIRVWGGGYYPHDWFWDGCDERGIVVWQDMMFSCANYLVNDEFEENITEEFIQQARRLRYHPSLGLFSGNNENEEFVMVRGYEGDEYTTRDYLILAEHIIPKVLKKEAPDVFYWPSSPSSGGAFDNPQDPTRGDVHYWEVWHGGVPFTEYRKYKFRYLSEFGFQSFPCYETVKSFTLPEDRNVFSRVMERHQRNANANGKILTYLSMNYLYPYDFETLLYASQLLQADAIRYGVEHFRRNRNNDLCMGAVYWQLNDIWPVASWASVDYFYRWKALQYAAKRFFAPVMISCEENCEINNRPSLVAQQTPNVSTAKLCVTNEQFGDVTGTVEWELRDPQSNILQSGSKEITVPQFTSVWLDEMDFSDTDYLSNHLTYRFVVNGEIISQGSVLFTAPKHYHFADPDLKVSCSGNTITLTVGAYAKSVEIYSGAGYIRLNDNYLDLEKGTYTFTLIEGKAEDLKARSVYNIR